MRNEEALAIADKPDWWLSRDGGAQSMRSLRQAIGAVAARDDRPFLFRPGGFGDPAIWLSPEQISVFRQLFASQADQAAPENTGARGPV